MREVILIEKEEFAIIVIDPNHKVFVVHIAFISKDSDDHLSHRA